MNFKVPPVKGKTMKEQMKTIYGPCILQNDIVYSETPIVLIHHLATKLKRDGVMYAKRILQWIGEIYGVTHTDVFITVHEDEMKYTKHNIQRRKETKNMSV